MDVSVSTSVGETITSVKLWTDATFKNYDTAIDFTSKLAQVSENEIFEIAASEVGGLEEFKGIYFLEFTTDDTVLPPGCSTCDAGVALGVAAELQAYQECLLEKVLKLDSCDGDYFSENSCNSANANNILNTKVVLDSLKYALQAGYYSDAINFKTQLDKLCAVNSWACNSYSDTTYYAGLTYCTIDGTLITL